MKNMREIFGTDKPIIGMLHLYSDEQGEILSIAKEEIDIYYRNGVNAVLAENYFGDAEDVEAVLSMLQREYPDKIYGVNILGDLDDAETAFRLADKYGAKFVQIDSVCGHIIPEWDPAFALQIKALRKRYPDVFLLGGVRFKCTAHLSGRSLEEDLKLGMERCDAIVVTGSGTGVSTDMDKIMTFRQILGDFPLVVGAGMTAETAKEQLALTDGAIVGSYFKQFGQDEFGVEEDRVQYFMQSLKK